MVAVYLERDPLAEPYLGSVFALCPGPGGETGPRLMSGNWGGQVTFSKSISSSAVLTSGLQPIVEGVTSGVKAFAKQ